MNNTVIEDARQAWSKVAQQAPFNDLESLFNLSSITTLRHADTLNQLKNRIESALERDFVDQDVLTESDPYYELIIDQQKRIPTRSGSWHDLFNGLIWLQFPRLKQCLNRWHVEDIKLHGLHPRTRRRNRITHFDECGVILAQSNSAVTQNLREHRWIEAMLEQRDQWGQTVQPFIFGHANLEMLLQPFVGLTGKWLSIDVQPDFFQWHYSQQIAHIDQRLTKSWQQSNPDGLNPLSPLPLLGVPGWCEDNHQLAYYQNIDYFRPKRSNP